MDWLAAVVLRLAELGPWAPLIFMALYVAAAVTLAPAFLLTVAAGALFGVWLGTLYVFIGASLGASAAYAVSVRLTRLPFLSWLDSDSRVLIVRQAVAGEGAWIQFLLRLSPLVPYNLLNYALGLSHVRYRDFVVALVGMLPAIVMYTYYGKVVGDVATLAAGIAPPRGVEYYTLLTVGLVTTVLATTLITRAARRAVEQQKRMAHGSTK
ncbi:MAG TPA: TVP38/TMEM64 family protein [Vicinamibacterales bacterium]